MTAAASFAGDAGVREAAVAGVAASAGVSPRHPVLGSSSETGVLVGGSWVGIPLVPPHSFYVLESLAGPHLPSAQTLPQRSLTSLNSLLSPEISEKPLLSSIIALLKASELLTEISINNHQLA